MSATTRVTPLDDLRDGARPDVPSHGTLSRIRQDLSQERAAGIERPELAGTPAWFASRQPADGGDAS